MGSNIKHEIEAEIRENLDEKTYLDTTPEAKSCGGEGMIEWTSQK